MNLPESFETICELCDAVKQHAASTKQQAASSRQRGAVKSGSQHVDIYVRHLHMKFSSAWYQVRRAKNLMKLRLAWYQTKNVMSICATRKWKSWMLRECTLLNFCSMWCVIDVFEQVCISLHVLVFYFSPFLFPWFSLLTHFLSFLFLLSFPFMVCSFVFFIPFVPPPPPCDLAAVQVCRLSIFVTWIIACHESPFFMNEKDVSRLVSTSWPTVAYRG